MRFPAARPRKTCDSVPLELLLPPPAPPSLALLTRQTEIVLVSPSFRHPRISDIRLAHVLFDPAIEALHRFNQLPGLAASG